MQSSKTVDQFITNTKEWKAELIKLREILLETGLTEEVKWGAPIYTHHGKNIVGMVGFKNHFTLWFHQGALLKDAQNKLINVQEGITRAQRQWRFTTQREIDKKLILAYVKEAIKNAEEGREIKPTKKAALQIPRELISALRKNGLTVIFKSLTVGRQREFAEYIQEAVRPETKTKRLEKIIPLIAKGIGLHDKYKPKTK